MFVLFFKGHVALSVVIVFFFFNHTATTEIYTLSLHDALPIFAAGSCSACHTRHRFSIAQARQPAACGKCHLGPDHPQMEVYTESKHGILWEANKERLNLDCKSWKPGIDYTAAPSCSSCHMGATTSQAVT